MLTRGGVYLRPRTEPAPTASEQLERGGYTLLTDALDIRQTDMIRADVDALFAESDTELRRANDGDEYRYAALNRSAKIQELVGNRDSVQRLRTTDRSHQLSPDAVERAGQSPRARTVVGLHEPLFYDG